MELPIRSLHSSRPLPLQAADAGRPGRSDRALALLAAHAAAPGLIPENQIAVRTWSDADSVYAEPSSAGGSSWWTTGTELHAWLVRFDPGLAARTVFVTGGAFTPQSSEDVARTGNTRIEKPFDAALRTLVGELVAANRRPMNHLVSPPSQPTKFGVRHWPTMMANDAPAPEPPSNVAAQPALKQTDEALLEAGALQSAAARGDLESIERIGHSMKGSGASFGFPGISDLGAALERAAWAFDEKKARLRGAELSAHLEGADGRDVTRGGGS